MSKITFGQVREIPKNAEETRTVPFVLSNPSRDRHHTILNQANWKLDNYRKNPVIAYQHNLYGDLCNPPNPDDIIGLTKKIQVEDLQGVPTLTADAMFEPASLNLQADKIFRKVLLGTLRGASVGFLESGKGSWGPGSEAEGRENETYRFAGQELLEWSIVNVPSNPNGIKRALRDQSVAALSYVSRTLGGKFSLSQIENMRIVDVLSLLDAQDLEIRETDPKKVREILASKEAQRDFAGIIEKQQIEFKQNILKGYKN